MNIKGVDVSYCQKGLDYNQVKEAGVRFAIIRAGAKLRKDSEVDYHVIGCSAIGIDYGFYWYSYAHTVDEVIEEAKKCLEVISQYHKPTYPVFFDMEEESQAKLGKERCTELALTFCEIIEKGGYPCGIYANPSWLENYYDKTQLIGKYDIWLAHWTESPDKPSCYNYGQTIHQWGVDNIGMQIDGNICYVDYPSKTAEWYEIHTAEVSKPVPAPEPKPKPFLHKGDRVHLRNAPLYGASTSKKKASTVNGTYWIHSDGVINGRIRITTPNGCKDCTGWVDVNACKKFTFNVGDTVRIRDGATTYYGGKLAYFVYPQRFTVMQVGKVDAADYIVIGQRGVVTAAVRADDLIKV